MPSKFSTLFRRLRRASPRTRPQHARSILAIEAPWAQWLQRLNEVHLQAPEEEGSLARTLRKEAARAGQVLQAARFRLIEARAMHRAGSPEAAADAFDVAIDALDAAGDAVHALKAAVLRIDALAHAGRLDEAFAEARAVRLRLRGRDQRAWRAALDVNEANALRLGGRLREAKLGFERAARTFDALGNELTAAIARTNAAVVCLDAGDGRGARRRLEAALKVFTRDANSDLVLDARENLACAMVLEGHIGDAIRSFQALVEEHEARGIDRRAAGCRMDLADALRRAGDLRGAAQEARAAARTFARVGAEAERAEALWQAAQAVATGRESQALLAEARVAAERAGRPGIVLRCELLEQDRALQVQGRVDASHLRALQKRAERGGEPQVVAEILLLRGHATLARGRAADALLLFSDPALQRPGRPWIRGAAESGRAACEAALGKTAVAIRRLRRVAEFLDAVRGALPGPWLRTTFTLAQLDPHLMRVDLLLARGRAPDRREAAALLDALAARRFLERARPERVRPTAAVRRRLEALYDKLARGDGPTRGLEPEQAAMLEGRARALEQVVADAWRKNERDGRGGRRVALARPSVSRLPRQTLAVHVWQRGDAVRALVREGDAVGRAIELGSSTALREHLERLAFHADRLRLFGADTSPAPFNHTLAELSAMLLGPLGLDRGTSRVRLVLDPAVPDVPWELLPVEGVPFSATRPVVRAPALAVRGARRKPGVGAAVVALGEADLPALRREVHVAGRGARTCQGADATRGALAELLATRDVVHIAGHGFDAPAAPVLSGIRVHDGWFTAADVPSRVAASLVVLSACRTGLTPGPAGDAWGGLPSTLLGAGARFVLWTADDVDDASASRLAGVFHLGRKRLGPAGAFGKALHDAWRQEGHAARLLPFRLSGIST